MKEFIDIIDKIEKQSKLKKYDGLDNKTYPSNPEQRKKLLAEPEMATAVEIIKLDDQETN
jgi:hypothetical protein|tara:strand:+ start:855 stop:1034 length:180 start_codon:yes stop_codon:yes gene_type:complete